nr:CesT family type III secretion system chaperone [uncultured Caldimonas sp.]
MSFDRYRELVTQMCGVVGIPDAEAVLARGAVEIEGYEVLISHFENDPEAMYLNFNFGIVTAGRTLRVFRLLLEANLQIYAQDQAQMGLNPDTGGVLLIVRVPMTDEIDGTWLADTFNHYIEHGQYWRDSIITATDEMFEGVCSGQYMWLRA